MDALRWVVDLDPPSAALPSVQVGPAPLIAQSPAENATVYGTVVFQGLASDPTSRVAEVRFLVEDKLQASFPGQAGEEAYPWTVDTRNWTFGNNRVTLEATDIMGRTTSAEVNVYALTSVFPVRKRLQDNLAQYLHPALAGEAARLQRVASGLLRDVGEGAGVDPGAVEQAVAQVQRNVAIASQGYLVMDSTSPAGPAPAFQDIRATGTLLPLRDEEVSQALSVPRFLFYGGLQSRIYVSSNGWIGFALGQPPGPQAQAIPDPATPNELVAAYWADLDPGQGGSIHWEVQGDAPLRRTVVQFTDVPHKGDASRTATFQVVLHETTGVIEVQYLRALSDGSFHAAGLENRDGTKAAVWKLGSFDLEAMAVRYVPHAGLVVR